MGGAPPVEIDAVAACQVGGKRWRSRTRWRAPGRARRFVTSSSCVHRVPADRRSEPQRDSLLALRSRVMGYEDLDRIDLKVTDKGSGELKRIVQCDFRGADEIALRPALSTVFALVRMATARSYDPRVPVEQVCAVEPPRFFVDAVIAAGGGLRVEDRVLVAPPSPPPPPEMMDGVVDRAFAALAADAAGSGSAITSHMLAALEARVVATITAETRSTDPLGYWTAVVELAAFAGELLRPLAPGSCWSFLADHHPPFAFAIEVPGVQRIRVYPLAKAQELIKNGPADSLVPVIPAVRHALHGG